MKFTALLLTTAIFAAGWGMHMAAQALLHRPALCDMPCRWVKGKGYADCSPITVNLDVRTTPRPTGGGEEIWYRATFTNNSCETLSLTPRFFKSNDNYASLIYLKRGEYLIVADSEGRALPVDSGSRQPEDAEGAIHPYTYDTNAYSQFRTEIYNDAYFSIPPGQSIATSPSILAPYREKLVSANVPGMIATFLAPVPVAMPDAAKHYAVPPVGFRKMNEYKIDHRGTYTAEIIVNDQAWAHLRYRSESYPTWLRRALRFLAKGTMSEGFSKPELPAIHAESNLVSFEVN